MSPFPCLGSAQQSVTAPDYTLCSCQSLTLWLYSSGPKKHGATLSTAALSTLQQQPNAWLRGNPGRGISWRSSVHCLYGRTTVLCDHTTSFCQVPIKVKCQMPFQIAFAGGRMHSRGELISWGRAKRIQRRAWRAAKTDRMFLLESASNTMNLWYKTGNSYWS